MIKKILFSFLIVSCAMMRLVHGADTRDTQGRTKLINMLRTQEPEIKSIQKDVHDQYHACYHDAVVYDGMSVGSIFAIKNGSLGVHSIRVEPRYRYETQRRYSCTDEDIQEHKKLQRDLKNIIKSTIESIRSMADSKELYVNAVDSQGYTAQNYCYTYDIYKELRSQGASFQCLPWIYFNPWSATASIIAATIASYYIISKYIELTDSLDEAEYD